MVAATKCSFEVLPHPPYSADLALSEFYRLPNLKASLRGRIVGSKEDIIDSVDESLEAKEECFYFEGISTLEQLEKVH